MMRMSKRGAYIWQNLSINGENVDLDKGPELWEKCYENKNNNSIYFPAELDYTLEIDPS